MPVEHVFVVQIGDKAANSFAQARHLGEVDFGIVTFATMEEVEAFADEIGLVKYTARPTIIQEDGEVMHPDEFKGMQN